MLIQSCGLVLFCLADRTDCSLSASSACSMPKLLPAQAPLPPKLPVMTSPMSRLGEPNNGGCCCCCWCRFFVRDDFGVTLLRCEVLRFMALTGQQPTRMCAVSGSAKIREISPSFSKYVYAIAMFYNFRNIYLRLALDNIYIFLYAYSIAICHISGNRIYSPVLQFMSGQRYHGGD